MFKTAIVVIATSLSVLMWGGYTEEMSTPTTPLPKEPDISPTIEVSVLVGDLDTPWAIDFSPDGRIFVTERSGSIRIIKDGILQTEPWLTLDVTESGESGLLGLALDPQFIRNGFVYVANTYRTGDGSLQNRLMRLKGYAGRETGHNRQGSAGWSDGSQQP